MCKELQGGYSFMIIFSHVYTTYFCAVESIFLFIAGNLSNFSLMIELVGLPRADSKFILGRGCFLPDVNNSNDNIIGMVGKLFSN